MNSVLRAALRRTNPMLTQYMKCNSKQFISSPVYSRAVWHMSSRSPKDFHVINHNQLCGCGCKNYVHTKGEGELVVFLRSEIAAELKAVKVQNIPQELDGFVIKTDKAEIVLTKECEDEIINICLNINHSVDADIDPDIDPKACNADIGDLKCKPNFEIDIIRGLQTLSFSCSFTGGNETEQDENGFNDAFCIDEVSMFSGQWDDNVYAVSGDVLDGNLYDLFMTILEEKGISSEFADKLSELATAYEHSCYIEMLQKLSKFAPK